MTAVMAIILFGGIRRLALVSEVVVPLMVLGYLAVALVVLALNMTQIPSALALIFSSAFGLEQAVGGGVAAAIAQGARRGLFSNEAVSAPCLMLLLQPMCLTPCRRDWCSR